MMVMVAAPRGMVRVWLVMVFSFKTNVCYASCWRDSMGIGALDWMIRFAVVCVKQCREAVKLPRLMFLSSLRAWGLSGRLQAWNGGKIFITGRSILICM